MKLLLVLGSDESSDIITKSIRPLGFELLRYRQVLKAMDNIDEINPTAIIISARDFPRHWKTFVQFVRSERPKENCPVILLVGSNFSTEESGKAFYLGVSGLVDEALHNPAEVERLQNILSRYVPVSEKRKYPRLYVEPWHRFGFLVADPVNKAIITGDVKTISIGGLSFFPSSSSMMKDITLDMELHECSLRAGDAVLSPVCRLVRTGRIVSMEFTAMSRKEMRILEQYLENLPLLEPSEKASS
ncbi:MAG: PilZ domain-containing protein [Treponema sp.]|jgi:DNA-binding response OmpR family regulator|nr:PilZ domain-containing protein [Treponema sp.]